jgi:hypothetical protein
MGLGNEGAMPASTGPADRPDVDIDKGEGDTPAVNLPGPKAGDDRAVTPGNLGWDEPSENGAETLEGGVRRADAQQTGEPGALPGDTHGH